MAGAYPDPPSYRMAWDEDGTQMFNLSTFAQFSESSMRALNSERGNTVATSNGVVVIFPELRDLDAIWLNGDTGNVSTAVSVDTTNGSDGTWTSGPTVPVVADTGNPLGVRWRSSIASSTALGIKAIRFTVSNLRNIHLYGEISPEVTEDRIEFWHPTADQKQPPNWFDWGNTPRQSTGQVAFRLKNMSPTLTANDVVVSMDALTDTTPSVPAQHLLSLDAVHWYSSIDLGDIAPNGLSPVAYLRRVTPSNAVLTTPRWAFRLKPIPTFWS